MASKKDIPPQKDRRQKIQDDPNIEASVKVGGDVNDSNVIIGSNNTINQKNIKTAHPREWVLYTLLILLLIGAIGFAVNYAYFRYDRAIASGKLNIVILPFVEERPWGYANTDLGWDIAQIFADGLNRLFEESGSGVNLKILGPADKVPKIHAFTERQVDRSAEITSEEINGQIVIYGIISQDEYGDSVVRVKFYISPTNFGEVQELISDSMVGELGFGFFRLTGDTVGGADLEAQNEELRDRLQIFSSIIKFLGAYLGEDFELAQMHIAEAGARTLWDDNLHGLEVVHLITGNMELRRARALMVINDLSGAMDSVKAAKKQFDESKNISIQNGNGSYARAYLGSAGAESLSAVLEANITGDASLIDSASLDRALKFLDDAIMAEYQPETADIDVKVNYGKAQIALAYYAKTGDPSHLDTARKFYQLVVDEYEETDNGRIVEFAALSQSGLGHISAQAGQPERAVEYFMSAQETTHNPSLKVQCLANIGDIHFDNGEYEKALDLYRVVLDRIGGLQGALTTERIAEIEYRINLIKGGTL